MNKVMFAILAAVFAVGVMAGEANAGNQRLTVQSMSVNGTTPTYNGSLTASTSNYLVRNDGRVFLHFKKSEAAACTVTIVTQATLSGYAVSDLSVTVGASTGDVMVGPFPTSIFNDTSGDINFTVSNAAGLTVAVMKL